MLTEKRLHELKAQLQPHQALLTQTIQSVRDQDISNYPIFVVYQEEEVLGLGLPVIAAAATKDQWAVNISTLEELVAKNVMAMENVERFSAVYKSNNSALCCLVSSEGQSQIVFIPN